jgi:hypothetical protein
LETRGPGAATANIERSASNLEVKRGSSRRAARTPVPRHSKMPDLLTGKSTAPWQFQNRDPARPPSNIRRRLRL